MSAPNGGPAFPVATIDGYSQYGMTLRDYFAGEAMAALMSNVNASGNDITRMRESFAEVAYAQADAMLLERIK